MSGNARAEEFLRVRLAPSPTALEQTLGLLRSRLRKPPPISLAVRYGDAGPEILIPLVDCEIPPERLAAELRALHDVRQVRRIAGTAAGGVREMALAKLTRPVAGQLGRVVSRGEEGTLVEITGSRREVDAALAYLRGRGVLVRAARTGGVSVD